MNNNIKKALFVFFFVSYAMAIVFEDSPNTSNFSTVTSYNYGYKGIISYQRGKPYKIFSYKKLGDNSYAITPSLEIDIAKNTVSKVKVINEDGSYAISDGVYNKRNDNPPHGTVSYFTSRNILYKKGRYFAGIPLGDNDIAEFYAVSPDIAFIEERTSQNALKVHKYYALSPTETQPCGSWEYFVDNKGKPQLQRRDIYSKGIKIRSITYP